MRDFFIKFIFILTVAFSASGAFGQSGAAKPAPSPTPAPTPTPDDQGEKIFTEEIRLNISAFDEKGNFATGVKKEDLVIMEDGRIHQADSLRRVPANILIMLDTGGEERRIKGLEATRRVAKALVDSLQDGDSIAVMEFNDKVKILDEWNTDKSQIQDVLSKKLGFGKGTRLTVALDAAVKFMESAPMENRHIVLVTDGIDSLATAPERAAAIKNVLTTSINVHVLSYTLIEQNDLPIKRVLFPKGDPRPKRLPEEVLITMPGPIQEAARMPRLGAINLDKAMLRKYKQRSEALKKSEAELTKLSEDTNGEMFLPETLEEMQEKTEVLAKNIDSQYTLTYTPKRPLNEVKADEVRNIDVSSRRPGLAVQGKRKLVVKKQ